MNRCRQYISNQKINLILYKIAVTVGLYLLGFCLFLSDAGKFYSGSVGQQVVADKIKTFLATSELNCAIHCHRMPTCEALNFNMRTKQCELLEDDSVTEADSTNDVSWTHYEVTD